MAASAVVVPALTEEAAFRWPLARWPGAPVAAVTLAAFVAWHPLGGLMLPEARPILWDPGFLGLAAGLGVACSASAWRSGTIWPAVAIHWAVVAAWTLLWGGPTYLR